MADLRTLISQTLDAPMMDPDVGCDEAADAVLDALYRAGWLRDDPDSKRHHIARWDAERRERIEQLEAALRPLVTQLDDWYERVPDDEAVYTAPAGEHWGLDEAIREDGWAPAYAVGDLRRARALIEGAD